jgi:hypothetical protein
MYHIITRIEIGHTKEKSYMDIQQQKSFKPAKYKNISNILYQIINGYSISNFLCPPKQKLNNYTSFENSQASKLWMQKTRLEKIYEY